MRFDGLLREGEQYVRRMVDRSPSHDRYVELVTVLRGLEERAPIRKPLGPRVTWTNGRQRNWIVVVPTGDSWEVLGVMLVLAGERVDFGSIEPCVTLLPGDKLTVDVPAWWLPRRVGSLAQGGATR